MILAEATLLDREDANMRNKIAFAFTGVLTVCVAAPAFAAPAVPARTIAQCEALAMQRPSGGRSHQQFLRDCLSGRNVSERVSMTYDECETLAEQRGSGPGPSVKEHNRFMTQCLAGKIPR
jgi:hypothetical protein